MTLRQVTQANDAKTLGDYFENDGFRYQQKESSSRKDP